MGPDVEQLNFEKPAVAQSRAEGATSNAELATKPDIVHRLYNDPLSYADAVEAGAEIQHLRELLDPRRWTQEMMDEWHSALPDMHEAFRRLRGG